MTKRPLYPAPALRNVRDINAASAAQKFDATIRRLHSILVGPASKPHEVKRAKARILEVLAERRRMPFPSTLIPPLTTPPRKRRSGLKTALGRREPIQFPQSLPGFAKATTHPRHMAPNTDTSP